MKEANGWRRGTMIDYFGARLFVPAGHFDETHMLSGGVPEPHVIQTFERFVGRGHIVIDVGANIGTHTFALAAMVGPEGKVFAIEADIDNAASLRSSIVESKASNIFLLPVAASDRAGAIRVLATKGTNSVFSASAPRSENKMAPTLPLDSIIQERVDFIKLDIEGAELLAVQGMTNIITYSRPLILTEFAPNYIINALGRDRSREFLQFFLDHRYTCQVVDPFGVCHPRSTIDEILESHANALRDYQWNHIELLFTPAELRTERLFVDGRATAAPEPAEILSPAAPAPAEEATPLAKDNEARTYLLPAFLAEPPAYADVDWCFEPPSLEQPVSQLCTSEQMDVPPYPDLVRRLGLDAKARHRKIWEFAFILAAIRANGHLRPGARGLGFGTGKEPLPSALAAAGLSVLATDAPAVLDMSPAWASSDEWAGQLGDLWHEGLISKALFDEKVSFRPVDMNAIPADLDGFDFCWSACCLEHLGSLRHGMDFVRNSLDTLRPGGVAIHTTEFNLDSNDATVEESGICIYRKQDLELLAHELTQAGHHVRPINLWPGSSPIDTHVDLPPYSLPHLKLMLMDYCTTSAGIIVQKRD